MLVARNRVDCILFVVLSVEVCEAVGGRCSTVWLVGALRHARASFNGRTRNGSAGASRATSLRRPHHPVASTHAAEHHEITYTSYASFYTRANTAKMSDDEERVTMPFKFVTGKSSAAAAGCLLEGYFLWTKAS